MMQTFTAPPRPLLAAFERAFPRHAPDVFVRAPGRVNLLGGHVDTHDGLVLTCALNREIWLAAAYGTAPDLVRLYAADLGEEVAFSLRHLADRTDVVGHPLPTWARYAAGIAWALRQQGLRLNGINAAFLGSVPRGAGLGSSAAVEVAFAVAWQALAGWPMERDELARVGVQAERDYLGVQSGIQDQFTTLHARADHALFLDCRTLEHQHAWWPFTAQVVVCDTQTRRELVHSGFSNRAQDAHAALHTIRLIEPDVRALRDVSLEQLEQYQAVLEAPQFRRARHVVSEIARVQEGWAALQRGDMAALGALMNASYHSARDDYGSSSPALDAMWQAATAHPACYGARYSGGGGAGAIVALVQADAVEDFVAATAARYTENTDRQGAFFPVTPSEGAGVLL